MNTTRVVTLAALWLLALGCNEYDFSVHPDRLDGQHEEPLDPGIGDSAEPGDAEDDDESSDVPWPEGGVPPTLTGEDCADGVLAAWQGGDIMVGSWSNTSAGGDILASQEGWYHAYSVMLAESGSGQRNESSFFRISNATEPSGMPFYGNCGDEWIVVDVDNNGAPSGSRLYVGTFWLDQGVNELEMNHYCPLYRAGACPSHHITTDSGSTCDSGNINSVHYDGYALCLVAADR